MKILIVSGSSVFDNLAGSEMQMRTLGTYLLGKGHSVVYYFREHVLGKPSCEIQEGTVVYRNEQVHGQMLGPLKDADRLEDVVRKEKPDILFARSLRAVFVLRRVSRRTGVPFVYQVPMAISREFFGLLYQLKSMRKSIILAVYGFFSRRALKYASMLLCISDEQVVVLKEVLGLEATTIYNMHPVPASPAKKASPPLVVWINNIKLLKRPELFIELASRCRSTGARFVMSGRIGNGRFDQRLRRQIEAARNLDYIGPTTLDEANALLAEATANVVTSKSEGFGNGNIQGWLRETPTITTVDKDQLVALHGIGFPVSNVDEMERNLRFLLDNPQKCAEMGRRAREYAIQNHSIEVQGPKYMKAFERVIAPLKPGRSDRSIIGPMDTALERRASRVKKRDRSPNGRPRVLFQQPAYAHYRRSLFETLVERLDIHFLFNREDSPYPSKDTMNADCSACTTVHTEKHGWISRLIKVHLTDDYECLIAALPLSKAAMIGTFMARLTGRKVVYWSLAWHPAGWPNSQQKVPRRICELLYRTIVRRADAVVVPGTKARKYHLGLGVSLEKLIVANHSSEDMSLRPCSANSLPAVLGNGKKTVLYLGRMLQLKGPDVLIKAFACIEKKIADAQLVMVGDGPYRKHCQELAESLKSKNIHFLGAVQNEDVHIYLQRADVFVLPNSGRRYLEAWGLAINEAMSLSLPIITTRMNGACEDLLRHGENGLLVREDSVESLAEALRMVLENDEARRTMRQSSRRVFEEFNSYDKMVTGLSSAIGLALQKRRPRDVAKVTPAKLI